MTSFIKVVIAFFYLIGCWSLIPASIFLVFYSKYPYVSIILFIISCGFLLFPSIIDVFLMISMKKNQKDESDPFKKLSIIKFIITISYLLGGLCFEIASVLYWPTWNIIHIGTWIFRLGSISYLIGSFFSIREIINIYKNKDKDCCYYLWIMCILFYNIGSIFFLTGGVLSQLGYFDISSYFWIIGSVGFAAGSTFGFIGTIKVK